MRLASKTGKMQNTDSLFRFIKKKQRYWLFVRAVHDQPRSFCRENIGRGSIKYSPSFDILTNSHSETPSHPTGVFIDVSYIREQEFCVGGWWSAVPSEHRVYYNYAMWFFDATVNTFPFLIQHSVFEFCILLNQVDQTETEHRAVSNSYNFRKRNIKKESTDRCEW